MDVNKVSGCLRKYHLSKNSAAEDRLSEADSILIMIIGFVLKQNLY